MKANSSFIIATILTLSLFFRLTVSLFSFWNGANKIFFSSFFLFFPKRLRNKRQFEFSWNWVINTDNSQPTCYRKRHFILMVKACQMSFTIAPKNKEKNLRKITFVMRKENRKLFFFNMKREWRKKLRLIVGWIDCMAMSETGIYKIILRHATDERELSTLMLFLECWR